MRFVNFFEFVGSAGAVAFALGEFDVGVVDVVIQPRFVDFSTLGLYFQILLSLITFTFASNLGHYPLSQPMFG